MKLLLCYITPENLLTDIKKLTNSLSIKVWVTMSNESSP